MSAGGIARNPERVLQTQALGQWVLPWGTVWGWSACRPAGGSLAGAAAQRTSTDSTLPLLLLLCPSACRYHPGMDEVVLSLNPQSGRVDMAISEVGGCLCLDAAVPLEVDVRGSSCAFGGRCAWKQLCFWR